jgi:streptogramin lyase
MSPAPFSPPNGSYPITVADGSVWVADPLGSTLSRYDPVAEQFNSLHLPAASGPVDISASSGSSQSLWVAAGREPSVFLIDLAHPRRIPRAFGTREAIPSALAVAPDGSAWIASLQADAVLAVTRTGMIKVHKVFGDRCDGPAGIAVTTDAVWVACAYSQRILRLDAGDGSVVSEIPLGGAPGAMEVDPEGAVWVTVQQKAFE